MDSIEKIAAAAMAKRIEAEAAAPEPMTSAQAARGRLNLVTYKLTAQQEIPNVLAAFFLVVNSEPLYTNVQFVPLLMVQAVAFLKQEDYFANLSPGSDGRYTLSSQVEDYLRRPSDLENLSLWTYVSVRFLVDP